MNEENVIISQRCKIGHPNPKPNLNLSSNSTVQWQPMSSAGRYRSTCMHENNNVPQFVLFYSTYMNEKNVIVSQSHQPKSTKCGTLLFPCMQVDW